MCDETARHMEPSTERLEPGHYGASNDFLKSLHAERRQRGPPPASPPLPPASHGGYHHTSAGNQTSVEVWEGMTNFTLSDVVVCRHGPQGRCLQCSGREPVNIPAATYATYCRAFHDIGHFTHPLAEEARRYAVPARSLVAGEIELSSFAPLIASLRVAPGERFLDLGSGLGRAVVAWALLLPQCTAAGIEIRQSLHDGAVGIVGGLSPELQQRVHLHCGDIFLCDWHEANVLLVNSTGFDDDLMAKVAAKVVHTVAGTRVITLSQPLLHCRGLELLSQAPYRMTWGNCTVYVYQRV